MFHHWGYLSIVDTIKTKSAGWRRWFLSESDYLLVGLSETLAAIRPNLVL
jgi:hypothetical protein